MMKRQFRSMIGFTLLTTVSFLIRSAHADPTVVEIFSIPDFPIAGIEAAQRAGAEITAYDLDAPKRWAKEMSAGLPGTLREAQAVAKARINQIGLERVKDSLKEAYAGHLKAFQYQLERYPAIVFDRGAAVVYGERDLNRALDRYREMGRLK